LPSRLEIYRAAPNEVGVPFGPDGRDRACRARSKRGRAEAGGVEQPL